MSTALRAAYALFAIVCAVTGAEAEDRVKSRIDRANSGTVSVIASSLEAPYLNYAADLADALDDGDKLRVLPVVGKGPVQTITDLIYLKGVDAGIVPADALAYVKSNALHGDADGKIAYLARLGSAQVHIVARGEITALEQLAGKRINIGRASDDRFVTASLILAQAGIEFTSDDSSPDEGLAKVKAGTLDAIVMVETHPSPALSSIKATDGMHLLSVPLSDALQQIYSPALLTSHDYPELIPAGATVETLSVNWVLAVFNWRKGTDRYDKLVKLTQSLYSQIDTLRAPGRHGPWGDVNLAASVPGWTRYVAAEEWLAGKLPKPPSEDEQAVALQSDFKAFLAESGATAEPGSEDALFERFVRWQQARGEAPADR